MKIILFTITYLVGLLPIFLDNKYAFVYFIIIAFAISIMNGMEKEKYLLNILHPLLFSTITSFLIFIVNGFSITNEIWFVAPLVFAYINLIIRGNKNESDLLNVIEYVMLPIAIPISLCFILTFTIPSEQLASYLYIATSMLFFSYLLRNIPTVTYTIIVMVVYNLMMIYLYSFLSFVTLSAMITFVLMINCLLAVNIFKNKKINKEKENQTKNNIGDYKKAM